MSAVYPRAYLDVNREPYELDPKMFAGRLPTYANVRSLRVAGGLGTIPRVVSDSANIYKGPLPVEEGLARIERIYRPYHDTLRRLLAQTHVAFGLAILIDCHSMPSNIRGGPTRVRPDFVLGDRFGASCMPELTDCAAATLQRLGYTVCRNKPYAGGFITEHYGRPARGLHALQIEVNRGLYMDEYRLEPHRGFERLSADLVALARIAPGAGRDGGERARGGGIAKEKGPRRRGPSLGRKRPMRAAIQVSQCTIYAALHKVQVEIQVSRRLCRNQATFVGESLSSGPAMKASNATQNWSRNSSRSIRISCRAPGMRRCAAVFTRRENSSAARLLTTLSAPASTISTGIGTVSANSGSAIRMQARIAR